MNEHEVAEAFERCLADIEEGRATLEQCLERYPNLRAELEPALRMVADIRAVPQWEVSRQFQATAKQRMIRRIRTAEERPSLRKRLAGLNPLTWPGRLALAPAALRVALAVVLMTAVLTGGTAIASSETLPDNPLYQVKIATETLELMLVPAGEGKTGLLISILDKRASELLTMAWQNKTDGVQRALPNYEAALEVGHKMLEADPSYTAFAMQWQEALARNKAVLSGLADAVPLDTQPTIRQAVAATESELAWVEELRGKTPIAPAPVAAATATRESAGQPTPEACTYIVRKGDNLSAIARQYGTTTQRLVEQNSLASADALREGQQLAVPCTSGVVQPAAGAQFTLCTYVVKSGDTLSVIAQRYNTTTRLLVATNNLISADRIRVGQKLSVPCSTR